MLRLYGLKSIRFLIVAFFEHGRQFLSDLDGRNLSEIAESKCFRTIPEATTFVALSAPLPFLLLLPLSLESTQVSNLLNHNGYIFVQPFKVDDAVGLIGKDDPFLIDLLLNSFLDILPNLLIS